MNKNNSINISYILKIITILIILGLSIFSGLKVYKFLDFTLGNTLQGIYSSYLLTESGYNKIKDVNSDIKNKVVSIISQIKDEKEQELIRQRIQKERLNKMQNNKARQKEIKQTKFLIDLIPMILAILFAWKMFSFIINLIIDQNSIINKIILWLKGKEIKIEE